MTRKGNNALTSKEKPDSNTIPDYRREAELRAHKTAVVTLGATARKPDL